MLRGRGKQILAGELILILLNLLCYGDWIWLLPLQTLLFPLLKEWDRYMKRVLDRRYALGFQELLQSLMTSIQAGYTLENACRAALPEMEEHARNQKDPTLIELRKIVHGLDLGIPIDKLFLEYALKTGNEDIRQFAGLMEIVKTTGGNLVVILKRNMENFQRKMDTEEEIRVILSGVIYEKNIMLAMPLLIFLYMRISNPSYMSPMYESLAGHLLMSCVLAGIVLCHYWTESLLKIRF